MTYLAFLLVFVVPPLALLIVLNRRAHAQGRLLSAPLRSWPAWSAVVLHILIAFVYTSPWDNYLVYSDVWGYSPGAVIGVIGWVPIEEYSFFVLQAALTGAWLLWLGRWRWLVPDRPLRPRRGINRWGTLIVGVSWLSALVLVVLSHVDERFKSLSYLSLILAWALPPIGLQVWYGADILWHYRRLVFTALLVATLYLSLADTIALAIGTWEIRQYTKTGIYVWPHLPIEEFSFFLVTNLLLVFGITLVLARETQARIPQIIIRWMELLSRGRLEESQAARAKKGTTGGGGTDVAE
jgi:putative membrane protein